MQEGQKWSYIMVESSAFEKFEKVATTKRQKVLEKFRESEKDFLAEDAKVLLCTAILTASKGKANKL